MAGKMKKVRILQRVGNPEGGAILAAGAVVELPEVWADRYIKSGDAELVEPAAKPGQKSGGSKKQ